MNRSILLLAIAGFFSSGTTRVCDALLPNIAETFQVSISAAAIAITAFTFAYGIFQLAYGPLGARIGPFRTVAIATGLSALTTLASTMAPTLAWLGAARFLSGVTCAAIIPMSMAYIGDTVPYEKRQPVLATFLMGNISGLIAGQALAGILGELFSWREVFALLGLGLGVVSGLLLLDLRRTALARPVSPPSRGPIMQYLSVLEVPWARSVLLTVSIEGFFCFGAIAFVGAYLREGFGLSYLAIGLIMGCFGLGGLVYAGSVRWLLPRLGEVGLALTGGLLLCGSFLLLAVMPVWELAPLALGLCGLGFYMLHNTLQTNATQMAPFNRSAAIALFAFCLFVSQSLGTVLLGAMLPLAGYRPAFLLAGVGLLLVAVGFRLAKQRQLARVAATA